MGGHASGKFKITAWVGKILKDNTTSQPATEYDDNIGKTMPFYDMFHANTIALVEVVRQEPQTWLDAGCGTGTLVAKASEHFEQTRFIRADPSAAMLALAQEKLEDKNCQFVSGGTEELNLASESLDVITGILANHDYSSLEKKRLAVENCFRMLRPGGIYINFESFKPASERGLQIALECWPRAQLARGKKEEAVEKYLSRCGTEFFPVSIDTHVQLLKESGLSVVEIFWLSGMQVGIYAIK